jgi:hypothetical protein
LPGGYQRYGEQGRSQFAENIGKQFVCVLYLGNLMKPAAVKSTGG